MSKTIDANTVVVFQVVLCYMHSAQSFGSFTHNIHKHAFKFGIVVFDDFTIMVMIPGDSVAMVMIKKI